ncbi:MAG: hypothetical protein QM820_52005 [Minicystis sp.]
MNKHIAATLGALSLLCAAGASMAGSAQADLGIDPSRMFFTFTSPAGSAGAFQVAPDNIHNPIVLPCDVQVFGGQVDIDYVGAGRTVYPRILLSYHTLANAQMTSTGYSGNQNISVMYGDLKPISGGAVQMDGYTAIDTLGQFRDWIFQPGDLPADQTVRLHVAVTSFADAGYAQPVTDPNPTNDARDIYVRRACSCQ